MAAKEPYSITAAELAARGRDDIPAPFIPARHLIYSAPATLSYNSPGALGFGVKRAGLVIPESAMLLVSPAACGRNSTILSSREEYADRMFYLLMDQTDLVTGRHLKRIPEAIREILSVCDPAPKVIVICITCVDALLGTDLEHVCREAQEATGVRVVPSYMYALEREGRRPPMTAIRWTIYSLLERKKVDPRAVNLLGFFTPLDPDSDIFPLLQSMGIRRIRQVNAMKTLEEYAEMGSANFNLVLHPEARYAAEMLRKKLGMPYIEFARLYDPDRMHRQYQLLASALGTQIDDGTEYQRARDAADQFAAHMKEKGYPSCAIGEMINGDPYELAAALTNRNVHVRAIFANVVPSSFPYIKRLAEVSPDTRIYTGIDPSMINYQRISGVDFVIGKDAHVYCPDAPYIEWNREEQPFGYRGMEKLLSELEAVL